MKIWHRFRSAITGLFVSRKYAEEHPETTVAETVTEDELRGLPVSPPPKKKPPAKKKGAKK